MLKGTQDVLQAFKMSGKPHYRVYYNVVKASGQLPCFESDDSADAGRNAERLHEYFALNLAPGKYLIQFKDKRDDTGGISNIFEIPGATGAPAIGNVQQNMPAIGYTPDTFNQIMDAKIGAIQKDFELQLLQKDIAKERAELIELRQSSNAFNNFIEKYGPLIVNVLAVKFGGAPQGPAVGMAGFTDPKQQAAYTAPTHTTPPPPPANETQDDETRRKLNEVIVWLSAQEGDTHKAVDLLYLMKTKGEQNPQLITMLKQFLNN